MITHEDFKYMQRKPSGVVVLDYDSMTQILAEIEDKIQRIESCVEKSVQNAEYDDLCKQRTELRERLGEMFSEKRTFRHREKSLNRKRGRGR